MKKLIAVILAFGLFLFMGITTSANAIPFPTYFKMKFTDSEYFNPAINYPYTDGADGTEDNWGVALITQLFRADDNAHPVWNTGDNGEELRVLFYGLDLNYWGGPGSTYNMKAANGGAYMDVYLWNQNDPNYTDFDLHTTNRTADDKYTTVTDGSTLVLRYQFTYGVAADQTIISAGQTSDTSNPPTGTGNAFLKVVDGLWKDTFDTNGATKALDNAGLAYNPLWIDPDADLYIKFSYNPYNLSWINEHGFQLKSEDPAYGAVPEPGTVLLLGVGLIGLAGWRRKK